jgi:hypothetical protein
MSQFKYTLPSGATFTMNAPDGTTQSEADYIFYSQVASGALVGFTPGQSVSGTQSALIKFALSRLDRGTAGVDDSVVLAIIQGLPTINTEVFINASAPSSTSLPDLNNIPLTNPINQADFVNINVNNTFSPTPIGPLSASQVQGLMAQVANFVDQPATTITQDVGIGVYGLFCEQLEQAGYVKPATYLRFIAPNPDDFVSTMSSPGIWTGLNGIYSLDEFLTSLSDQNFAQLTLMQNAYESLIAVGVITPPVTPSIQASRGYVYTQSGLQTVSAVSAALGIAISVPSALSSSLSNTPLINLLSTTLDNFGSLASGAINNVTN